MHFPRIQKRARYTVLRLQKRGLIGFRDVPGAPPLLPKLIAIIVRLNRVEALSFSPVVNAQMPPILTRDELNSFHFAPLRLQSTNHLICEAERPKVF